MAEPVLAFQFPDMEVLLKSKNNHQEMNQPRPARETNTHNFYLSSWLENLMGETIDCSSVMMIAIHTYIMFVSEPFKDLLSWWGQGNTRWDKTWPLCSSAFGQILV